MNKREHFLTLFKIGYTSKAPGTWGSAFGLIIGIPILYFSASTLFVLAILVGIIAIKQIDIYEKEEGGIHDASYIVIDELIGIWFAMSIAGFHILTIIFSFIFFRIYDIWKPSIIRKVDKNVEGGLGVVGDDVLAGFFAGISSLLFVAILSLIGFDIKFNV
ncbi:hypothetical protein CCY99_03685 [Helicobacter sp. 16-1353]|uniref:phosphatidylglycerophosphatase A family protein n=1 Tax=Helicobacter sp. 16-1353 TaxID=2004996 RepID=UPI000DCD80CE|nr:phosphatidylglycerophosphatase A [Helicobacter sp. 16-1353]RAX54461.1 hypothetical protein CCY99_03685 [Helicobacter sp. 16-1353]